MKKNLFAIILLMSVTAQADIYWIGFTDKQGTEGTISNPELYLSSRSIERRERQNIKIDSLDLPVSKVYTDSLTALGAQILYPLRWLNGVTARVSDNTIVDKIKSLSFVNTVQLTRPEAKVTAPAVRKSKFLLQGDSAYYNNKAYALTYMDMIRLGELHKLGFKGEGKLIAVIDHLYSGVDYLPVFEKARQQIEATYNVVDDSSVYGAGTHGAMVLELLAGNIQNQDLGTAPSAKYVLITTEEDDEAGSENLWEVDNQCRGFEYADSIGADVISSSLGYYEFDDPTANFTYSDMDGKTARNSISATIAAHKGMAVCISAGNEYRNSWHYLTAPSDARDILCVGAVTADGTHSSFSSVGPAADGRVKPDVAVLGTAVNIFYPEDFRTGSGTSFACPITAGMTASLWSALPDLTSLELMQAIRESGSTYFTPSDTIGYGIPDAMKIYERYKQPTSLCNQPTGANSIKCWIDIVGRMYATEPQQAGIYIAIYDDGSCEKRYIGCR